MTDLVGEAAHLFLHQCRDRVHQLAQPSPPLGRVELVDADLQRMLGVVDRDQQAAGDQHPVFAQGHTQRRPRILHLVEHHRDGDRIGHGGNVGGFLAGGRLGGEVDQVPGCLEPLADQRQPEWNRVGVLLSERFQQGRHLGEHCIIELFDVGRQRVVELRQRVARAQHAHQLGEVMIGRWRCRVGRELGAGLRDGFRRAERVFQIF